MFNEYNNFQSKNTNENVCALKNNNKLFDF